MKKAEMEQADRQYEACRKSARTALSQHEYEKALLQCKKSLEFIDGKLALAKRELGTNDVPLPTLDWILQYAPALFQHDYLTDLQELVAGNRKLKKLDADYLARTEAALRAEETAARLWNHIAATPGCLQRSLSRDIERPQKELVQILEVWEEAGIVLRESVPSSKTHSLTMVTDLDRPSRARCWSCGLKVKATRRRFLVRLSCVKCKQKSHFVLLD